MRRNVFAVLLPVVALLAACSGARSSVDPETAERLREIRNLGKAFYENPGSSQEAVETLAQAVEIAPDSAVDRLNHSLALLRAGDMEAGLTGLQQAQRMDPSLPHTYFNLGVEYKKMGEAEKAIEQFEKMVELVPDEAKAHYNLGQLYKQLDRNQEAREKFELAAKLDPSLGAPRFQLYNLLRREDREAARAELEEFQRIKKLQDETDLDEDVDWSYYSELADPIASVVEAEDPAIIFAAEPIVGAETAVRGAVAADFNADGLPDAAVWGVDKAFVLTRTADGFEVAEKNAPAEIRSLDVGDPNNDGYPEICVATADAAMLRINDETGFSGMSKILATGDFEACLFHDYDHDNDADVFLLGSPNLLLRNNAPEEPAFEQVEFPFAEKRGLAALAVELFEDNGNDLVVAYEDGVVVYQDLKLGRYDAEEPLAGVDPGAAPVKLEAVDLDSDGFFDIALTAASGETTVLQNDRGALSAGETLERTVAFGDFGNRGAVDGPGAAEGLPDDVSTAVAADFDQDGRVDLLTVGSSGPRIAYNRTETSNGWASVRLTGVKSAKLAKGSRVEVKAGRLYRKQLYQGYPLHFGLGGQDKIETVRITWTNGMIQNEINLGINEAFAWNEKPRLSGSCPMIFTWNGEEFEYISEVLGAAPLGASLGDGRFFPVDHDEYVSITSEQLAARDGFYDVRITEELREVAYIDQVRLLAIDRPSGIEVYTNEKFKAPPFPEFRLFGVREEQKIRPASAVDHRGSDVLNRVSRRDGRYVDGFQRTYRNTAEPHSLTVDLTGLQGGDRSMLFLTGWVDWADASTIVASAQTRDAAVAPPVLQVRDGAGEWRTVIADLGLPGGRPRTMVVDLTGKFLSDSREVRILTNMCVYWDEIFAADGVFEPDVRVAAIDPSQADLGFRGFSENIVHPARLQPESFNYQRVGPTTNWDPTPGDYTAFGDALDLLEKIDDRLVVMGAGDELRLRFPEPPAAPQGRVREFLLFVDGWAKENEANTAFGDSVEPLPFHRMSAYPYSEGEDYPHLDFVEQRNSRPALRLTRPLAR